MPGSRVRSGYYRSNRCRGCVSWCKTFSRALARTGDLVCALQLCCRCCVLVFVVLSVLTAVSYGAPFIIAKINSGGALESTAGSISKLDGGFIHGYGGLSKEQTLLIRRQTAALTGEVLSASSKSKNEKSASLQTNQGGGRKFDGADLKQNFLEHSSEISLAQNVNDGGSGQEIVSHRSSIHDTVSQGAYIEDGYIGENSQESQRTSDQQGLGSEEGNHDENGQGSRHSSQQHLLYVGDKNDNDEVWSDPYNVEGHGREANNNEDKNSDADKASIDSKQQRRHNSEDENNYENDRGGHRSREQQGLYSGKEYIDENTGSCYSAKDQGRDELQENEEKSGLTGRNGNRGHYGEDSQSGNDDVSHRNDYVSHRNDDLSHRNDDVSHRNDDVSHRNYDVSHRNDDVSHRNDDVSHRNDDVSHRNDDVSHRYDDDGQGSIRSSKWDVHWDVDDDSGNLYSNSRKSDLEDDTSETGSRQYEDNKYGNRFRDHSQYESCRQSSLCKILGSAIGASKGGGGVGRMRSGRSIRTESGKSGAGSGSTFAITSASGVNTVQSGSLGECCCPRIGEAFKSTNKKQKIRTCFKGKKKN